MLDLEVAQGTLRDLLCLRLAANYTTRSAYEQGSINAGLQEQITIITRDEAAVVQRIAELRLVAEGGHVADSLQDLLDAVLVLKTQAEAALAT